MSGLGSDCNPSCHLPYPIAMKRLALLIPLAFVIGCNDRDSTDVKINTAVAITSAREAISTAWNSAMREAGKVTASSSQAALEEAKAQTAKLQDQLSKIEIKNPLDEAQMKAVQTQMDKIQAAMSLKNLRQESEQAVANAMATGKIAEQQYEQASQALARIDAGYRDLKEKLDSAQFVYDQASSAWSGAVDKVKHLGGS